MVSKKKIGLFFRKVFKKEKPLGLVLSGGGARGIAHLGILQSLKENGIHPSYVSGTSIGAIVGALYCAGIPIEKVYEKIKELSFLKIFHLELLKSGLGSLDKIHELLSNLIDKDSFEDLDKKLFVSVANLNSGEYEIISSGRLFEYITASSAIPILFHPVEINGNTYVDGGLLNNFPIEPLENRCDRIIGVNVNVHTYQEEIKGIRSIGQRCFELSIWNNVQPRLNRAGFIIEPEEAHQYSMFEFKKAELFYKIGYEKSNRIMPELLKYLGRN